MFRKMLLALLALCAALACAVAEEENLVVDDFADEPPVAEEERIAVEDYSATEGLPDDWWNILLLGTDSRYSLEGRTDSMIVLSVNLTTQEAKLTSLMRDLWVPIDGRSRNAKLNAANVYGGPELTMRTVNECFGMNVTEYVLVNITGLADIIDALGGIEIDVTEAERRALNRGLFDLSSQSGMEKLAFSGAGVHLNGNQAVAFSRIRNIDNDYQRTQRQRTVLTALAGKLKENDPGALINVVSDLMPYVRTNLSIAQLLKLAYVGLKLDLSGVAQLRLPVDGTFDSGMRGGTWAIYPDFERNRQLMYEFIYGA